MWNDWESSCFIKLGHKENHAVCISLDWQKKQLEIAAQKNIRGASHFKESDKEMWLSSSLGVLGTEYQLHVANHHRN